LVTIRFSEKIKNLGEDIDLKKLLNSSNLLLRIIQALDRDEEEGFSPQ